MSRDRPNSNCRNRQRVRTVHCCWSAYRESCAPLSYHECCGCRDSPPDTRRAVLDSTLSSWSCWNMSNCISRCPSWSDRLSACAVHSATRWRAVSCWRDVQRCRCHHHSWNISRRAVGPPSWGRRACSSSCCRQRVTCNYEIEFRLICISTRSDVYSPTRQNATEHDKSPCVLKLIVKVYKILTQKWEIVHTI